MVEKFSPRAELEPGQLDQLVSALPTELPDLLSQFISVY